jgi:hypothetical protein
VRVGILDLDLHEIALESVAYTARAELVEARKCSAA